MQIRQFFPFKSPAQNLPSIVEKWYCLSGKSFEVRKVELTSNILFIYRHQLHDFYFLSPSHATLANYRPDASVRFRRRKMAVKAQRDTYLTKAASRRNRTIQRWVHWLADEAPELASLVRGIKFYAF